MAAAKVSIRTEHGGVAEELPTTTELRRNCRLLPNDLIDFTLVREDDDTGIFIGLELELRSGGRVTVCFVWVEYDDLEFTFLLPIVSTPLYQCHRHH